ncbi:hypothetical protein FQR65_LT08549 [Abscondita terminalis]|nr:hypothetical protein FQR65_LT08549 [Abscondita terminalis]
MDHNNIKIIFVVPSKCKSFEETSAIMQQTFDTCKQNNIDCEWYLEEECVNHKSLKTDFFIFQDFHGKTFDQIRASKSIRILGPWCLLTCLMEGKRIPNYSWPIYSVAMMDCTVAFSSLNKAEKKELQEKVEYMGGYVTASLTDSCTHLVTNSVKSEKYIKAAEAGKKIMLDSWVTDVWDASLKANIHCTNVQFNRHICPVFHNLVVCCTGLSNTQRNELLQMVTEHGGIYKEQLHVHKTDIVVIESRTLSAKYKAAKKYNIKCVNMMWVTDSIKNGYAMPDGAYKIQIGTSTPTKDGEELPNFSMISNIGNATGLVKSALEFSQMIDATNISKLNSPMKPTPSLKRKSNSNEHNDLVDEINLKNVKKAGPFLDGCGVYLLGFGNEQREKLCKILNFSGATRYNDISDRVTHVVVGDENCLELKHLRSKRNLSCPIVSIHWLLSSLTQNAATKNVSLVIMNDIDNVLYENCLELKHLRSKRNLSCPIVSIHWLLSSLTQETAADEERFLLGNNGNDIDKPGSPLCKKSLHLLKGTSQVIAEIDTLTPTTIPESIPASENDIIQQYIQPHTSDKEDTLAKLLTNDTKFDDKHGDNLNPDQTKSVSNPSIEQANEASSAIDDDDDSSELVEPVFESLKFVIDGFTKDETKEAKIVIEKMSGTVVPKTYKGVCDYAVVPAFSSASKHAATYIVNDLWISECWHENEKRPIEYFHQPISVDENAKPLKDCVVTISVYTNYERNFLKNLIAQLGGVCQELLSRVSNENGLSACTHLVSPEANGKKYAAAVRWGLPVITKDWLLECAKTSKYAQETPFLVGDAKPSLRCIRNSDADSFSDNVNEKIPLAVNAVPSTSEIVSSKLVDEEKLSTPKLQLTPTSYTPLPSEETPLTRKLNHLGNIGSQITPVQKIIAEARRQKLIGSPEQSIPRPLSWDHVDTPETPLGRFIDPNPSPNLRKQMVRYLNTLPDYKPRRDSTPLSELKRKLWDKICPPKDCKLDQPNFDSSVEEKSPNQHKSGDNGFTTPNTKMNTNNDIFLNNKLMQLQDMLTASGGNRSDNRRSALLLPSAVADIENSQPNTIGWDEHIREEKKKRVFMFSGVEQEKRSKMIAQLEKLGASVTNALTFDPTSTHLICSKPSRNEKILASMSAGKWILHECYVEQCALEGKFLDEEFFEFGNPKSNENAQMHNGNDISKMAAVHTWRMEVSRRGYGAFHDMRLIVVAEKREPLVRVLQAGGGMIIDERPPFTKTVHATHCLLDLKFVNNIDDYAPLAQQGILCVNTLYVNDFLMKNGIDTRDYIVPYLLQYYDS